MIFATLSHPQHPDALRLHGLALRLAEVMERAARRGKSDLVWRLMQAAEAVEGAAYDLYDQAMSDGTWPYDRSFQVTVDAAMQAADGVYHLGERLLGADLRTICPDQYDTFTEGPR